MDRSTSTLARAPQQDLPRTFHHSTYISRFFHSRVSLNAVLAWGFWAVNSWIWFQCLLFRRLPYCGPLPSQWVLLSVLLLCGASACAFSGKNGCLPVARSLLCAYGVYTAAAYAPLKPWLIAVHLGIPAVASAALALYILSRPIRPLPAAQRRRIRRIRAKKAAVCAGFLFAAGSAVLLAVLGISTLTDRRLLKASVPSAEATVCGEQTEQTIEAHAEELSLLRDDRWSALSAQEKLDILQVVANIEQRYLGLPNELHVNAAELGEDPQTVLSSYSDTAREILIDYDILLGGTSWDLVNCVAHEARHCYQYRLAELYLAVDGSAQNLLLFRLSGADAFAEELAHYQDASDDLRACYEQALEQDARIYAAEAVEDYRYSLDPPLSALPGAAKV